MTVRPVQAAAPGHPTTSRASRSAQE